MSTLSGDDYRNLLIAQDVDQPPALYARLLTEYARDRPKGADPEGLGDPFKSWGEAFPMTSLDYFLNRHEQSEAYLERLGPRRRGGGARLACRPLEEQPKQLLLRAERAEAELAKARDEAEFALAELAEAKAELAEAKAEAERRCSL